jgi:hypothetical protein
LSTEKQDDSNRERIDPKIFQTALTQEMSDILFDIRKLLSEAVPEGIVQPIQPITVRGDFDRPWRQVIPPDPGKLWFNVSVTNDGPNSIFILVNSQRNSDWHRIDYKEVYEVHMERPKIYDVLLKCNLGDEATVRLVFVR